MNFNWIVAPQVQLSSVASNHTIGIFPHHPVAIDESGVVEQFNPLVPEESINQGEIEHPEPQAPVHEPPLPPLPQDAHPGEETGENF